jgi:hypothetical protein
MGSLRPGGGGIKSEDRLLMPSAESSLALDSANSLVVFELEQRNARAQAIIAKYAKLHAGMDVAVGIFGLLPGLAIPALVGAIAAQAPVIYIPMAKEIAAVYLASPDDIKDGTQHIVLHGLLQTSALDVASEFGTEFMMQIGFEIIAEAGLGVIGALAIPVMGGAVGAALDYLIATQMTWRVGTMVSIYYQNGGSWLGSQKDTYKRSKEMSGSFGKSIADIIDYKKSQQVPRVDLDSIRSDVPEVRQSQLRNLRMFVSLMKDSMSNDQIRASLTQRGVPADLIRDVLVGISNKL